MDSKLYQRIYQRLTRERFSVSRIDSRQSCLLVEGLTVACKVVSKGRTGWRVTIHRHGALDEAGIDAYLIALDSALESAHYTYLVFPAPLERTTLTLSPRSLINTYAQNINNWELLRKIAEDKKSAVTAA